MGGLSDLWGVHIAPMFIHPIHLDTPICSESFNMVFILLVHKMFSYFRGSHGGLSGLECIHIPPMFIYPLYVLMPPLCLDTPIHLGASEHMGASKHIGCQNIWGHPNIQGAYGHTLSLTTLHDCI